VPFEVRRVDVDETPLPGESPWQGARRTALLKLACARMLWPEEPVLTADTVVELDGQALGKPVSAEDAVRTLERLRARCHLVHTCVAAGRVGVQASVVCTTRVRMRAYGDEEVRAYVATGDPMDKAGAYAIQAESFLPVEGLHGSYSNVVGLPLAATARLLRLLGLEVTGTED
jgi:septum formation protein